MKTTIRELKKLILETVAEMLQLKTIILRPEGWKAAGDDGFEWLGSLQQSGHVFRGMTSQEYNATVGSGKPIMSTGAHSFSIEGTNFTDDPHDAESYVNYGRDDPRTTGKPNYLVRVKVTDTMKRESDGYIKSKEPVPLADITGQWEMYNQDDAIVAKQIG